MLESTGNYKQFKYGAIVIQIPLNFIFLRVREILANEWNEETTYKLYVDIKERDFEYELNKGMYLKINEWIESLDK